MDEVGGSPAERPAAELHPPRGRGAADGLGPLVRRAGLPPAVLTLVPSADLDDAPLALLEEVFDDLEPTDWEHCLGGVHALVHVDGALVAHGALVPRTLVHAGRPLRTGYVEGVAVRPDLQRRGLGSLVMAALEPRVTAYDLGALAATDEGMALYAARGWRLWRGPLSVSSPSGPVPTPDDDGCVFVLGGPPWLDVDGGLTCDPRPGDVW